MKTLQNRLKSACLWLSQKLRFRLRTFLILTGLLAVTLSGVEKRPDRSGGTIITWELCKQIPALRLHIYKSVDYTPVSSYKHTVKCYDFKVIYDGKAYVDHTGFFSQFSDYSYFNTTTEFYTKGKRFWP